MVPQTTEHWEPGTRGSKLAAWSQRQNPERVFETGWSPAGEQLPCPTRPQKMTTQSVRLAGHRDAGPATLARWVNDNKRYAPYRYYQVASVAEAMKPGSRILIAAGTTCQDSSQLKGSKCQG